MLNSISEIGKLIGNTKLYKLNFPYCELYAKLEFQNLFGSIKDRPAFFILSKAIKEGLIDGDATVIESTSGNFGIALAFICKKLGIKFIPVIDPNISCQKEQILKLTSSRVIKVEERDSTGGYLLSRIKVVKDFITSTPGSYNPNQYENPDNYLSYYYTLGSELCDNFQSLDFAFISTSSGGTIIGLSLRLKEKFPNICIVAVDVEGSLIFCDQPKKRLISGIGASMRSPLIDKALIDEVVILSQFEIVQGCDELFKEHSLLVGASSGAAYMAAKKFLKNANHLKAKAVFICPDHGSGYVDSVFSRDWINKLT